MGKSEVVGLAWQRCGIRRESEMEKERQTRPHETKLSRVVGSAERPGRKARSSKEDEWEREARKARAVPTRKSAAKGSANVLCGARVGHGERHEPVVCRWSVETQYV